MLQNMNYNMQLAKLNSSSGTFPLLRILQEMGPVDKRTLFEEAKKYGVGQSAFNSSINALQETLLVEEKEERFHLRGTISKMQYLTDKGKKVADLVRQIDELLL